MKINDILKPGYFTTPGGRQARLSGIAHDETIAPQWRNRVLYYGWIVTLCVEGQFIDIKFDTHDNFKAIKYTHEPPSEWRVKL